MDIAEDIDFNNSNDLYASKEKKNTVYALVQFIQFTV